jgi:hypothetical protein
MTSDELKAFLIAHHFSLNTCSFMLCGPVLVINETV